VLIREGGSWEKPPPYLNLRGGKGRNTSRRVAVGREHCPTCVSSEGGVVVAKWGNGSHQERCLSL